jgi:RNA polymerase sigma-70 factor (ECF subfamily)
MIHTDETIIEAVQRGDREQFGVLMERYEDKLVRYGRRFLNTKEDLSDAVQDVFIKAYENIQDFDASRRFSPWIYRIAHNTFVNKIRSRRDIPLFSLDLDTLVSHPVYVDPRQEERDREEVRAIFDEGMAKLSPAQREIIMLYYLEELSYQEIADVLRIPIGTVGVRLKRAKEALKAIYETDGIRYE